MYTESEALGRVSCYHFSQKEASRGCYRAPIMKWAMENCLIEIGIPSWRSSKPEPSCQFPGPRVLAPTTEYRSVSVSLHRSLHHLRSCPQNGNGGRKIYITADISPLLLSSWRRHQIRYAGFLSHVLLFATHTRAHTDGCLLLLLLLLLHTHLLLFVALILWILLLFGRAECRAADCRLQFYHKINKKHKQTQGERLLLLCSDADGCARETRQERASAGARAAGRERQRYREGGAIARIRNFITISLIFRIRICICGSPVLHMFCAHTYNYLLLNRALFYFVFRFLHQFSCVELWLCGFVMCVCICACVFLISFLNTLFRRSRCCCWFNFCKFSLHTPFIRRALCPCIRRLVLLLLLLLLPPLKIGSFLPVRNFHIEFVRWNAF